MNTNKNIKYNSITNSKTTHITIKNNYDFSVSNKKMKEMNHRCKYYKITYNDY